VISSEDGGPIVQARIVIVGSQTETYSRIDGSFELILPAGEDIILNIRRSGYDPLDVSVTGDTAMEIVLLPDTSATAQKIMLGYDIPSDPYYSPPRPLGGDTALKEFIDANLQHPDSTISGVVHILFTVSKEGSLENFKVLSTPGEVFDREVIKILQQGPPWYPAEQNGKIIPGEVDLRFRF
jgi:TonB family protein